MSDQIGIRGSAKEKAQDKHNAKVVTFNAYTDELHALRCTALGRIAYLVQLHGSSPVPNDALRSILKQLDENVAAGVTNYETKIKQIEEAYK